MMATERRTSISSFFLSLTLLINHQVRFVEKSSDDLRISRSLLWSYIVLVPGRLNPLNPLDVSTQPPLHVGCIYYITRQSSVYKGVIAWGKGES